MIRLLARLRCALSASHDTVTVGGVTTCRRGCGFRWERTEPSRGDLTRREYQVARRMVDGLTSKEIAADLGLSYWTVAHHRQVIYLKCGVAGNDPTAALELAKVLGYLKVPPEDVA